MKLPVAIIVASLLLIQSVHGRQSGTSTAIIRGMVLREDTGTPIAGAIVQLIRNGVPSITYIPAGMGVPLPPQAPGPPPPPPRPDGTAVSTSVNPGATLPAINALIAVAVDSAGVVVYKAFGNGPGAPASVTTDSEGRYSFTSIEPGLYRVFARADGYSTIEYGSRVSGYLGTGSPFVMTAGQVEPNVDIRMAKTGAISGRLTGADGAPLTSKDLVLLRPGFDRNGKVSFQYAARAETDDRGMYRFYDVNPGRYYLLAGASARTGIAATILALAAAQVPELPLYYPGTVDASSATLISVTSGSETRDVNLMLDRKTLKLSGRIDGFGAGPGSISITFLNESAAWNDADTSSTILYNRARGEFEIPGLSPGMYVLGASFAATGGSRLASEFVSVAIDNKDVGNIVLSVPSPPILSGRVTAEGPDAASLNLQGIQMQIRSEINGALAATVAPSLDGKFQVSTIPFGKYRLTSSSLPAGFYIKGITMSETAEPSYAFKFESGAGALSVVLSSESGQIAGVLKDVHEKRMPNVQVFLVPDRRERLDLYKTTLTDNDGHYAFNRVPFGGYKVFAWEFLYTNAYLNSTFLQSSEKDGSPIHVGDSEKPALDLLIIPNRVVPNP